jgi:hypothetical protein
MTGSMVLRLLVAAPLLALCACNIPANQPLADASYAAAAKAASIAPDQSRLYAYVGERDAWFGLTADSRMPADVKVNGITVGGVNRGECLVVDLPPGQYRVSWSARTNDLPIQSDDVGVRLVPGQPTYLSFDIHEHVGQMFGVIGLLANPPTGHIVVHAQDGRQTVEGLKIVLPNAAAVAQVHPITGGASS